MKLFMIQAVNENYENNLNYTELASLSFKSKKLIK